MTCLHSITSTETIRLVDGDAAIWANGCWAWPNIEEAGATKQLMIDAEQSTEEQQAAAKEFINWLVYSDNGQKMLVETAAIIPACKNNSYEALDPLGKDIQSKMSNGNTYSSCFIAPSDHWSVLGASMQKYLAGESTKSELAGEIDNYWTSQK